MKTEEPTRTARAEEGRGRNDLPSPAQCPGGAAPTTPEELLPSGSVHSSPPGHKCRLEPVNFRGGLVFYSCPICRAYYMDG